MKAEFWNERFSSQEYVYGEEPNAFLKDRYTLIPRRGRVLCLGDGEGRNGVFLARKGFDVTSVDASEVGLEKTRKLAERHRVTLRTIHGRLPEVEIEEGAYDAVVLVYLHLPPDIRAEVHALAARALRPGGVLLLEGFTPEQLEFESGGPKDAAMLFTPEMLRADFAMLDIEGIDACRTVLDEGPGHRGEAAVVRLIAVRGDD